MVLNYKPVSFIYFLIYFNRLDSDGSGQKLSRNPVIILDMSEQRVIREMSGVWGQRSIVAAH